MCLKFLTGFLWHLIADVNGVEHAVELTRFVKSFGREGDDCVEMGCVGDFMWKKLPQTGKRPLFSTIPLSLICKVLTFIFEARSLKNRKGKQRYELK